MKGKFSSVSPINYRCNLEINFDTIGKIKNLEQPLDWPKKKKKWEKKEGGRREGRREEKETTKTL